MALDAINRVRDAELNAQKQIEQAELDFAEQIKIAEALAETIVCEAKQKAQDIFEHSAKKAVESADEIIVTARNSAVLQADKLKKSCAQKQQDVNKRILEIII